MNFFGKKSGTINNKENAVKIKSEKIKLSSKIERNPTINNKDSFKLDTLEKEKQMLKVTLDHVIKENEDLKNKLDDMKQTVQHNKKQLIEYVNNITNKEEAVFKLTNTIEQLQSRLIKYELYHKKAIKNSSENLNCYCDCKLNNKSVIDKIESNQRGHSYNFNKYNCTVNTSNIFTNISIDKNICLDNTNNSIIKIPKKNFDINNSFCNNNQNNDSVIINSTSNNNNNNNNNYPLIKTISNLNKFKQTFYHKNVKNDDIKLNSTTIKDNSFLKQNLNKSIVNLNNSIQHNSEIKNKLNLNKISINSSNDNLFNLKNIKNLKKININNKNTFKNKFDNNSFMRINESSKLTDVQLYLNKINTSKYDNNINNNKTLDIRKMSNIISTNTETTASKLYIDKTINKFNDSINLNDKLKHNVSNNSILINSYNNNVETNKLKEINKCQINILEEIQSMKNDLKFILDSCIVSKNKIKNKINCNTSNNSFIFDNNNNSINKSFIETKNIYNLNTSINDKTYIEMNETVNFNLNKTNNRLENINKNNKNNNNNSFINPLTNYQNKASLLTLKNSNNNINNTTILSSKSNNKINYRLFSANKFNKKIENLYDYNNNNNNNNNSNILNNKYNFKERINNFKTISKFQNFLDEYNCYQNILILIDSNNNCWELIKRIDLSPEDIVKENSISSISQNNFDIYNKNYNLLNVDLKDYEGDLHLSTINPHKFID